MQLLFIVIFVLLSAQVQSSYPTSSSTPLNVIHRGSSCVWSPWGYWSECSTDCGSGTQTRRRECECGLLAGTCEGDAVEIRTCEVTHGCDESVCQFGEWSAWSGCSDTCNGLKYRKQKCQCGITVHNDSHCKGRPLEESEVCNLESEKSGCCNWEWINNWSNTNSTCCSLDGTAWRRQACMCAERGLSSDSHCNNRGPFQQEQTPCVDRPICKKSSKKSKCAWKEDWSAWSPCSVTHGEGLRYRSKKCSCGDPQLCPFPAPLETELCYASSDKTGVWIENNVTTQCDAVCGVGAYWIGATCLCNETYCDASNCWGLPHTYEKVCVGNDCPKNCEWDVTDSGCGEEDSSRLNDKVDVRERYREDEDEEEYQSLDDVERKFLEEKKNLLKKTKPTTRVITRRCKCGGVEVNSEYCFPQLEVYEVKPCHQEPCSWAEWKTWSDCDDGGKQIRTRSCSCADENNNKPCEGNKYEERLCNINEAIVSEVGVESSESLSSPGHSIVLTLVVIVVVVVIGAIVLLLVVTKHLLQNRKRKQLVLIY